MRRHLGVVTSDRKLHQIVYVDVDPPRRGRAGGTFPIDQQIHPLFRQPFTDRSLRTPDRLQPKVQVLHMAMRKTILPSGGSQELLTSLQQWILLSIWTGEQFDFLDFMLCEIEDVNVDAINVGR